MRRERRRPQRGADRQAGKSRRLGAPLTWLAAAVLTSGLVLAPDMAAEGLTGSITAGYVWRSDSGSLGSFKTQHYLGEGISLEDFSFKLAAKDGSELLSAEAWGFGGSEPYQKAHIKVLPAPCWRIDLAYDRRDSAFEIQESDLSARTDTWSISRWKAGAVYEGLEKFRLSLRARYLERTGNAIQPFLGLNQIYPLAVVFDRNQLEGAVRLETKGLGGFHGSIEQALAWASRRDSWSPGGPGSLVNPLTGATTTREDKQVIPTTRAMASYTSTRFEVTGSLLFSRPDFDTTGDGSKVFALSGGQIGRIENLDQTAGSATMDTWAANLRMGFAITQNLKLRLLGNLNDSRTDSALLGQRLLRLTSPTGHVNDIVLPIDEAGMFDTKDQGGRIEIAWEARTFAIWAGGFAAQRDVSWKTTQAEPAHDAERDTRGTVAGASLNLPSGFRLSAEYEHGAFDGFVFRTEPETVDRLTGRLQLTLSGGFSASVHGRWEEGSNPPAEAALDRQSKSGGLTAGWEHPSALHGISAGVNISNFHSETGILLPAPSGGIPGTSIYDLSAVTFTAAGHVTLGPVRIAADGSRVEDDGDTWPLTSWTVNGRVSVRASAKTELSAFVQHYSYDESRADRDDYEVSRYGLLVRWDF